MMRAHSLRKLLLLATALAALALALAACKRHREAGDSTLIVWHAFNNEETTLFKEMLAEFEASSGKKVVLEYVSYGDMFTKLQTSALAKKTPDVAFLDSIKVTDLAFGSAAVKINELEGFKKRYGTLEGGRKHFVEASYNMAVIDRLGNVDLYGIPVQTTTVALFWNRAMFRAKAQALRDAGLDPNRAPRTWDELIAYGKVLTDPKRKIFGFGQHSSLWFNFVFFNLYNVEFIQYGADGVAKPGLNTPRGRAAMETIGRIVNSGMEGGAWKRGAQGPDLGFLNEFYAMCVTGSWNVERFRNQGLEFDIAMIPAPSKKEIEELGLQPADPTMVEEYGELAWSSSNLGGQTGVILQTAPDKEAAYEFLEWFTSEPIQRRWASTLGQIPVRRSAWKDLDTTKYPFMTKFMEQLRVARRIPQVPKFGILESQIFNPEIDLYLNGGQNVEQMMRNMDRRLEEKILRRMRVE